jgi:hypothetical protein
MLSATDIDPSPGVPHANGAAYRRSSTQVKTPLERHRMPGATAKTRSDASAIGCSEVRTV